MAIASFSRATCMMLLTLLASGAAHAVYRCGKVYQDRPCDDRGSQKYFIPGAPAPKPAGAAPRAAPFTSSCALIGQEAQQMARRREGGATREKQLAELPNTESRDEMARVLDLVYRKRGNAHEIKAAVQAECVAEKRQAAETAATIKALQSQQRAARSAAATPASAAAPPTATDAPAGAGLQRASASGEANSSCSGWRDELASADADLRRGGSAAEMEQFRNHRRAVEKSLREGRC